MKGKRRSGCASPLQLLSERILAATEANLERRSQSIRIRTYPRRYLRKERCKSCRLLGNLEQGHIQLGKVSAANGSGEYI